MLRARKERGTGKRFILKDRVVISIDEVLLAIEAAEKETEEKKKKIGTGRRRGRPRKNRESIIVLEDEDDDLEIMECENVEVE